MLTIGSAQMQAVADASTRQIVPLLADHLKRSFAPRLCDVAGDDNVRRAVEIAVGGAQRRGFVEPGPLRFYVELTAAFGIDFDTDPQLPWAGGTFADPRIAHPLLMADRLYDRMRDYAELVLGVENARLIAAARRVSMASTSALDLAEGDEAGFARLLSAVYPERCVYMGKAALGQVMQMAVREARQYGLQPGRGVALMGIMLLFFGSGVAHDPFYSWIEASLRYDPAADGQARASRLEARLRSYGTAAIEYLSHPEGMPTR